MALTENVERYVKSKRRRIRGRGKAQQSKVVLMDLGTSIGQELDWNVEIQGSVHSDLVNLYRLEHAPQEDRCLVLEVFPVREEQDDPDLYVACE